MFFFVLREERVICKNAFDRLKQLDFLCSRESSAKKVIAMHEPEKFFSFSVDASNAWGKQAVVFGLLSRNTCSPINTKPSLPSAPSSTATLRRCWTRALDTVEIAHLVGEKSRTGRERENDRVVDVMKTNKSFSQEKWNEKLKNWSKSFSHRRWCFNHNFYTQPGWIMYGKCCWS